MNARARLVAIVASVAVVLPAYAVQRTFVASYGTDANVAANCTLSNPCRGFTAAQTVTDPNGEIIALDAAGYGSITITKSITITANPGFYAGISAATGNAVTIATAGVQVTLRGLNLNGVGASNGISMTNGARLSVENCVITNFFTDGLFVSAAAIVRVTDSVFRDNISNGITLDGGVRASISGSKLLGNGNRGVLLLASGTTTSVASLADSQIAGSFVAVQAAAQDSGVARLAVIATRMTNNSYGPSVDATAGGTAVTSFSSSLVSGNENAGFQSGAGALESLGNNTIRQNQFGVSGTMTTVPQS